MRIALATLGSWGDLQPFVHLAAALRTAGHRVSILTQPEHRERVGDECGVAVTPICSPLDPEVAAAIHKRVIDEPDALRQLIIIMRFLVFRDDARQYRASLAALPGHDLVLTHGTALHSQEAALTLGLSCLGVVLTPAAIPDPALPPGGLPDLGPLNRLAWAAGLLGFDAAIGGRIRRSIRRAGGRRRHLHPAQMLGPDGILVAASPALTPKGARRDALWTGPWHRPPPPDAALPAHCERFLATGEPPLYAGFGSMEPGGGDHLAATAVAAARSLGRRIVLQSGWAGMTATGADVCVVDHLPHDLLLPRVAAIAHHCGAGTSHAAARSGIPSVPVPFLADQPWFAARLRAIDAATPPVPRRRLTTARLAAAYRRALEDGRLRTGAQRLAAAMRGEDGCARAITAIEAIALKRAGQTRNGRSFTGEGEKGRRGRKGKV